MNKETRKYLTGVALGFIGIIMYTLSLTGYENIYVEDVLSILEQAALPFIFTEIWVLLMNEGLRSLKQEYLVFKKKQEAKRNSKKEAEA